MTAISSGPSGVLRFRLIITEQNSLKTWALKMSRPSSDSLLSSARAISCLFGSSTS